MFLGFGLFCALYSSLSCRWYVFTPADVVRNDWSFLPLNSTEVASIGLFRYQIGGDNTAFEDPRHGQCAQYNPLFLGSDYAWLYTAQICLVLGPVMGVVAWLFAMTGVNKHPTAFFLLVATGIQTTAVVASMTWCDEFYNCPWLLGSLANAVAACLFFLSWLVAMFCLQKEKQKEDDSDASSWHSNSANGDTKGSFQWEDDTIIPSEPVIREVRCAPDPQPVPVPVPDVPMRSYPPKIKDAVKEKAVRNYADLMVEAKALLRKRREQEMEEGLMTTAENDGFMEITEEEVKEEEQATMAEEEGDEMDAAERGMVEIDITAEEKD
jgi:hypothetical protein